MNNASCSITPGAASASGVTEQTAVDSRLDLTVPLRECEPWCAIGNGHPEEMPGDRNCRSEGRNSVLTLEEPYQGQPGVWVMSGLEVSLRRDRRAAHTEVVLYNTVYETAIAMTLDEAERHALHILAEIADARLTAEAEPA